MPNPIAAVCTFLLATASIAQAPELRAVWVARDGLGSRTQIVQTLDQLAAANCNCVCVNVWSRGFTIHPSQVLFAACGQSQDPSYVGRDPLAEFVLEAHRRGIEVEAWFEYGFMFGWNGWHPGPTGVGPVLTANPSWIGYDDTGNSQVSDGGGGFFTWASHEHPAVRQFLLDLAVEVARNYDVDGIQFDRVRYPSTSFGYDAATVAAYQAATGQAPPTNVNATAWKAWRASRLVSFHQDLYNAVKAERPTLRVTDAPTVMPGAYDTYLQDWPAWLTGGSLDLVYPQVYRTTVSQYTTTLDQQLTYVPQALRAKVAPGIRAITGTSPTSVLGMVAANRARNLPGHVFWYAAEIGDDLPGLVANYFQQPVAVPQQPAGWRPPSVQKEENDATTQATAAFVLTIPSGASGGLARIASSAATGSDKVVYTLPVSDTGLHSLLAYVPGGPGYSSSAPYVVATATGPVTVRVDQSATGASWRELATVWLTAGTTTVEVRAVPGQVVLADAVGLLRSRWPSGPFGSMGAGTSGTNGGLRLAEFGRAGRGGVVRYQASQAIVGAPTLVGVGLASTFVPLFGGTLYLLPDAVFGGVADGFGLFDAAVAIPPLPGLLGVVLYAQGLSFDPLGVDGVSLSPLVVAPIL
ncbi:MAG: family 10 glycosylhydrolase [Planctomycetes bacterium]|nr:family 10 glycosylhydrolase [Planctomycetota bacterium]